MTETEIPTPETQEVLEPTIEDMIQAEDGVPFTTSLAIAQAFGKEHKDVLRAISNMECSPEFVERNFALYEYSRDLGIGVREYPAYRLTRDGFAFLAMGFTGKKAAAWKERFLEAFNAMEAALLKQQRQKEAERLERQRQKELTEQKNLEQQEQPAPRPWEKPEEFRSARKLTRNQTEALMGLLNMECLLQDRQPEDVLKELLAFFHVPVRLQKCRLFRGEADVSLLKKYGKRTEFASVYCRHKRPRQLLEPFIRLHQRRHPDLHQKQVRHFPPGGHCLRSGWVESSFCPVGRHLPLWN